MIVKQVIMVHYLPEKSSIPESVGVANNDKEADILIGIKKLIDPEKYETGGFYKSPTQYYEEIKI